MKWIASVPIFLMLVSCAGGPARPTPVGTALVVPSGMSREQAETLASLQLVDDHPLYTMRYVGAYREAAQLDAASDVAAARVSPAEGSCPLTWGCSLFAALGDEKDRLYGRNFDWDHSPAVLLFTDPPDGYASVSMVDIHYLGFDGEASKHIFDLPLDEREALLDAPYLPFDGMNEKGLAVGMAAVPEEPMPHNPANRSTDNLGVIREILDHAATVDEAVELMGGFNIDMGSVPVHYLIASEAGNSALVEFRQGEMVVFRNEAAWQMATNFLVSATGGRPQGRCPRYDRLSARLEELKGRISAGEAFRLLRDVSQESTQWSIVYHMTSGDVSVVMGRDYAGEVHEFKLREE